MNRVLTAAALAAALFLSVRPISAQVANGSSRDRLVVSAAWLAEHLNDRNLLVLQVGRRATYDAGHIPGARFVDVEGALSVPMNRDMNAPKTDGLMLEMLPAGSLHDHLAALGISDNSRIVIVASDNYWSASTRVVLTLDYAGLANVSWMDGGVKAWGDAGRALSTTEPAATPGTLSPLQLRPVIVDAEFVKSHARAPGFAIVDARARSFYDGTPPQGGRGDDNLKPGHIPGALSAPYNQFASSTSGSTDLKPAAAIEAMLQAAGVKPGDTVIGYCHVGQQATAMLFAARTLGHNVLLYDGSMNDWNRRKLPLDNPSAKKDQ